MDAVNTQTESLQEVYEQRVSGLAGLLTQAQGMARLIEEGEHEPHPWIHAVAAVLDHALRWLTEGEAFEAALLNHAYRTGGLMVGDTITFSGRTVRITGCDKRGQLTFETVPPVTQ